ncbi:copper amine oxidase N-terminal domain-containing protein [Paenibacillus sp. Aloe-11]|uniref:copper amine oxidase N-terminal domain-containing protein n=1 Tax=Paenibacillus sp. Aloe-11 TaxID=1050222 RepID=UPI001E36136E|nr:copper amine oxidase N-terminal domain-containing protein [Paenibacillus sp. Aloe-11]
MLFRIILIGALFFCFSQPYTGKMSAQSIAPSTQFLKINNYYILFTTPKAPYIDKNNRYMVPLRSVNDLLGGQTTFDPTSNTATIKFKTHKVEFKMNSTEIVTDSIPSVMDTVPVLYKNSMFVPLGVLTKQLNIHQEWDQQNKLYSLSGKELMKTPMMENVEDLDHFKEQVDNENAFHLLSYKLSLGEKIHLSITAKNVTRKKISEGIEDLNTTFIFSDNSTAGENRNRKRPSIDKDEMVTRDYNIDYVKTIENSKIFKNELSYIQLSYILFKGRTLKP